MGAVGPCGTLQQIQLMEGFRSAAHLAHAQGGGLVQLLMQHGSRGLAAAIGAHADRGLPGGGAAARLGKGREGGGHREAITQSGDRGYGRTGQQHPAAGAVVAEVDPVIAVGQG